MRWPTEVSACFHFSPSQLSWLGGFSFSHSSLQSEPAQPRQLKLLWYPLFGQTRSNHQTLTSLNGPSTKLPSSAQGQGTSYHSPNAFQTFIQTFSGLIAYREFSQEGYDVHVFERDNSPGGNWHYTEETFPNTPIPNEDISVADFEPSFPPEGAKLPYIEEYHSAQVGEKLQRAHRSPKPIWVTLVSHSPAVLICC